MVITLINGDNAWKFRVDSCDWPSNFKWDSTRFFSLVTLKFDSCPRKTIGNLSHAPRSYVCHCIATHELKLEMSSRNAQIGAKSSIFQPVWHRPLTSTFCMVITLINGDNAWKFRVDSCDWPSNFKWDSTRFFSLVTLKFDSCPRKTIGNLFHAPRSYVCHCIATHELKLEMSSRNAQIGAKSSIFQPVWHRPLTLTFLHGHHFDQWW